MSGMVDEFRKAARDYVNRLVDVVYDERKIVHKAVPLGNVRYTVELVKVARPERYGEILNWGTLDGGLAVLIRENESKKKMVLAIGASWSPGQSLEVHKPDNFIPYDVDFFEYFKSKMAGVNTGMIEVVSMGTREGKPAIHAINRVYNQEWVWCPGKGWPIEFKVDSFPPDELYVAE